MDISEIAHRSVIKSGMEIFIADRDGEFVASNSSGNCGMVFLKV
jgi:hypothetical protein